MYLRKSRKTQSSEHRPKMIARRKPPCFSGDILATFSAVCLATFWRYFLRFSFAPCDRASQPAAIGSNGQEPNSGGIVVDGRKTVIVLQNVAQVRRQTYLKPRPENNENKAISPPAHDCAAARLHVFTAYRRSLFVDNTRILKYCLTFFDI